MHFTSSTAKAVLWAPMEFFQIWYLLRNASQVQEEFPLPSWGVLAGTRGFQSAEMFADRGPMAGFAHLFLGLSHELFLAWQ